LNLADYADDFLGGATQAISYRFSLYGPPSPLLGQQPVALPKNICVDLSVSLPAVNATMLSQSTTGDYDIIFAPSGQVLPGGAGATMSSQIFLWVRDYTKGPNPLTVTSAGPPITYDMNVFRSLGEQQIVSLKSISGGLGVFPVTWPQANGQYANGQDAFTFARVGASAP
jgi:hypothetical protein